jgi:signal transduction histidine kinase
VARELRPPSLDALGLVGAIRQQADGLAVPAGAGPAIVIDAPESMPPLPAATEVAAYRIATEALLNVVRHSDARVCAITIAVDRNELSIEIEDDGNGVGDAADGVGTRSIYERAAEVGGDATIDSRPGGGTRVLARLPFAGGEALR